MHQHANYLRNPITGKKVRIQVYEDHQTVSANINLLEPDKSDAKLCVSSPVGDICVSLKDVIDLIISIMEA